MGHYVIAVGGTGNKILESIVYAACADAFYTVDDRGRRQTLGSHGGREGQAQLFYGGLRVLEGGTYKEPLLWAGQSHIQKANFLRQHLPLLTELDGVSGKGYTGLSAEDR